jgi:hypothetical protein
MTVRRTIAAAFVATALLAAQARPEADPHELYERAADQLEQGRLQDSCAAATRLRELIAARPQWDPEETFSRDLLPPLEARQKRLLGAARALDQFHDRTLEELRPPDLSSEISTVRDYTHWATTVVQRLRSERDGLVQKILTDPADAAILARTDSWARTERLLEVEVLKAMAEKAGDDVLGLLSGDAQLESVLVRFRQLKKDLIETMAERDALQGRLDEAEKRRQATAAAVAAAVLEAEGGKKARRDEATGVQSRFTRLLQSEKEAIGKRPALTPAEKTALEGRVERLRLANKVLTAAGIIRDQRRAVEDVARAVAALPVQAGPPIPAADGYRWRAWTLAALLGAIAGFGVQLVLRHRRPGATPDPPRAARDGDATQPGALTEGHQEGADDRRHAA